MATEQHLKPTAVDRFLAAVRGIRRDRWAAFALVALAMTVRLAWAAVTSWREDQATMLWLGALQDPLSRPVGLVSSTTFPNPNGMTFIGSLLALAPGLYASSALLALIQVLLLGWLCREVFRSQPPAAWLAGLVLACDPVMAYLGVEFWNQYTVGLFDVAFVASAVRFSRAPSWRYLPLWAFLAMAVPGLYLAGLANAAAHALIAALLVTRHRRALRTQPLALHLGLAAAACVLVACLVWVPYAGSVSWADLKQMSPRSQAEGVRWAAAAVWAAPANAFTLVRGMLQTAPPCIGSFPWQGAAGLRTAWPTVMGLLLVFGIAAGVLRAALTLTGRTSAPALPGQPPPATGIALCFGFVWLSFVLSPLLGGPALAAGERPDQMVRLLPLLMVAAIAAALSVPAPGPWRRPVRWVAMVLIGTCILLGTLTSAVLVTRHLAYRGPELTDADVPLLNKTAVVRFIARDWRAGDRTGDPSVYYHLMSTRWVFIPEWGALMRRWYPRNVYTVGRGFDYELWRVHGLRNAQEGRARTPQTARYVVSYAREPEPQAPHLAIRHTVIGRLRVSIVE